MIQLVWAYLSQGENQKMPHGEEIQSKMYTELNQGWFWTETNQPETVTHNQMSQWKGNQDTDLKDTDLDDPDLDDPYLADPDLDETS